MYPPVVEVGSADSFKGEHRLPISVIQNRQIKRLPLIAHQPFPRCLNRPSIAGVNNSGHVTNRAKFIAQLVAKFA
jgi:hypothetical protein